MAKILLFWLAKEFGPQYFQSPSFQNSRQLKITFFPGCISYFITEPFLFIRKIENNQCLWPRFMLLTIKKDGKTKCNNCVLTLDYILGSYIFDYILVLDCYRLFWVAVSHGEYFFCSRLLWVVMDHCKLFLDRFEWFWEGLGCRWFYLNCCGWLWVVVGGCRSLRTFFRIVMDSGHYGLIWIFIGSLWVIVGCCGPFLVLVSKATRIAFSCFVCIKTAVFVDIFF